MAGFEPAQTTWKAAMLAVTSHPHRHRAFVVRPLTIVTLYTVICPSVYILLYTVGNCLEFADRQLGLR
jgi:hypothetical protein